MFYLITKKGIGVLYGKIWTGKNVKWFATTVEGAEKLSKNDNLTMHDMSNVLFAYKN